MMPEHASHPRTHPPQARCASAEEGKEEKSVQIWRCHERPECSFALDASMGWCVTSSGLVRVQAIKRLLQCATISRRPDEA